MKTKVMETHSWVCYLEVASGTPQTAGSLAAWATVIVGRGLMIPPRWLQRGKISYIVTRGTSQETARQVEPGSPYLAQLYKPYTISSSAFSFLQAQSLAHIQGEKKWTSLFTKGVSKSLWNVFKLSYIAKIKFIYSYKKKWEHRHEMFFSLSNVLFFTLPKKQK